MKNKKIGWAIVGLGLQGNRIAQAINNSQNGKLIAAMSSDKYRAEKFAKKYGAAYRSVDLGKILEHTEIDAVFISSPTYKHKTHALTALKAQKHVLCEKPMALHYRDEIGRAS